MFLSHWLVSVYKLKDETSRYGALGLCFPTSESLRKENNLPTSTLELHNTSYTYNQGQNMKSTQTTVLTHMGIYLFDVALAGIIETNRYARKKYHSNWVDVY